jgi:phage-related protein
MAVPIFSPPCGPSTQSTSLETDARILTAQFGDGYQQVTSDGINTTRDTWTAQWDGLPTSDQQAIYNFFQSMGGWQVFQWTAPGDDTPKLWRCAKYGKNPTGPQSWSVTATIIQTFDITALT